MHDVKLINAVVYHDDDAVAEVDIIGVVDDSVVAAAVLICGYRRSR